MNTVVRELIEKWESIEFQKGGSLQLGISHPLKWHVAYFESGKKSIVIVSDSPADKIESFSSNSIKALCSPRKDGRYAITLTLLLREQQEVFITMCADLINYSATEHDCKDSLLKVLKRYVAWFKLLQHKREAFLSDNAQKGLIGELLFLREQLEKGLEPSVALAGWVGPDDNDQDFVYENCWHEIKTVGKSSVAITITSAEQLDCALPGELVVMRIDKCAPAQTGSFTLNGLVHQITKLLSSTPGAKDFFDSKLASAGYIEMPEYDNQNYVYSSKQIYDVNETFPRIIRENLPSEIISLNYVLSIPAISPWMKGKI